MNMRDGNVFKPKTFTYLPGDIQNDPIKREMTKPSEVNYFAFDLQVKQLIDNLLRPVIDVQDKDRIKAEVNKVELKSLADRCHQLELVFDQNQGRNKVFDYIDDRLSNFIIASKHQESVFKESIQVLQNQMVDQQLIQKNQEVLMLDSTMRSEQLQTRLKDQIRFADETKLLIFDKVNQFELEMLKDINMFKQSNAVNQSEIGQLKDRLRFQDDRIVALESQQAILQQTIVTLQKRQTQVLSTILTKVEFEQISYEQRLALQRVEYGLEDVKAMNATTDEYIDKFIPFRINKEISKFFQTVLEDYQDIVLKAKMLERSKLKDLYTHLCNQNVSDLKAEFKDDMLNLKDKLQQDITAIDLTKSQNPMQLSMAHGLLKAIEKIAGSTEMNPELSRQILILNQDLQTCFGKIDQLQEQLRQSLGQDGQALSLEQLNKKLNHIQDQILNIQRNDSLQLQASQQESLDAQLKNTQRLVSMEIGFQMLEEEDQQRDLEIKRIQMDVERIGKLADALSKLTVVECGDEKKLKIKNGKELFNMSQTVTEFQSTFLEPLRGRKKSPQKGMRFQTVFKLQRYSESALRKDHHRRQISGLGIKNSDYND